MLARLSLPGWRNELWPCVDWRKSRTRASSAPEGGGTWSRSSQAAGQLPTRQPGARTTAVAAFRSPCGVRGTPGNCMGPVARSGNPELLQRVGQSRSGSPLPAADRFVAGYLDPSSATRCRSRARRGRTAPFDSGASVDVGSAARLCTLIFPWRLLASNSFGPHRERLPLRGAW